MNRWSKLPLLIVDTVLSSLLTAIVILALLLPIAASIAAVWWIVDAMVKTVTGG